MPPDRRRAVANCDFYASCVKTICCACAQDPLFLQRPTRGMVGKSCQNAGRCPRFSLSQSGGALQRSHDQLCLDASPLPECHRHPEEPLLCRRLRLWKEREADSHRRSEGAAQLRTRQAGWHLGKSGGFGKTSPVQSLITLRSREARRHCQLLFVFTPLQSTLQRFRTSRTRALAFGLARHT